MIEINAVIHRADKHGLRTEPGMLKREFPLRAALGMGDFLHPPLRLIRVGLISPPALPGCAFLPLPPTLPASANPRGANRRSPKNAKTPEERPPISRPPPPNA